MRFRVRPARGNRSPYAGNAELDGKPFGSLIVEAWHLSIADLDGWEIVSKPPEILLGPPPGQTREHVIDGEEQASFGQIDQQANQIVATPLNFHVVAFGQIEYADVHGVAAGHAA